MTPKARARELAFPRGQLRQVEQIQGYLTRSNIVERYSLAKQRERLLLEIAELEASTGRSRTEWSAIDE